MKPVHLMLAAALTLPAAAGAVDYFDGSHTLLCTIHELNVCTIADECTEPAFEEVDAPRYFLADFANNRLVTTEVAEVARESMIDHMELLGDKLLLQGRVDRSENAPHSVAWSLSIADPEGTMAFSLVRDDVITAAFGACVPVD